jgi:hypothetical protein
MPTANKHQKLFEPVDIYGYFHFSAKSTANLLTILGLGSANLCRWAVTKFVRTGYRLSAIGYRLSAIGYRLSANP